MAAAVMSSQTQSLTPPGPVAFLPSKLFKVKNVDDKGRIIHIGFLEVTDTDIMFTYEHYPTEVTKWPLACIRRYGINGEGDIFALEAGRRAPDGEGLYAFKTTEATEIRQTVDYYTSGRARAMSQH